MKYLPLFLLFSFSMNLSAQMPQAPKIEPTPEERELANLPEEKRMAYAKVYAKVVRLYQEKRIIEALNEVEKLLKNYPTSAELYNTKASCYVELRDFKQAIDLFEKAMSYTSNKLFVKLNIVECHFVMHEWDRAEAGYRDIIPKIKELGANVEVVSLLTFKHYLVLKKLGKTQECQKIEAVYSDMDDTPYAYFVNAAKFYDAHKNDEAAAEIMKAGRVFSANQKIMSNWQDSMVEYGYITSSYGGDSKEAKAGK